jgi:hypothetical protein
MTNIRNTESGGQIDEAIAIDVPHIAPGRSLPENRLRIKASHMV